MTSPHLSLKAATASARALAAGWRTGGLLSRGLLSRCLLSGLLLSGLVLSACASSAPAVRPDEGPAPLAPLPKVLMGSSDPLELAESFPLETPLDDPAIRSATDVWKDMIEKATTSVDFGEFYFSDQPGSQLSGVVEALIKAADRGVKVRFLADARFAKTYPEGLATLDAHPNIEVRKYDLGAIKGGVLHAKYFIVDGSEAILGSQNFDFRSLMHIHELGVRFKDPTLAGQLQAVFALDWAIAGGESVENALKAAPTGTPPEPVVMPFEGKNHEVQLFASPQGLLPPTVGWELPAILQAIDQAHQSILIEVHSIQVVGYDKTEWRELEDALKKAAARGVKVEILVSDWSKKKPKVEAVISLAKVPGIVVKWVTIPPHTSGFIDFARTIHAKCGVVDGRLAWVSTSNFAKDYFYNSRNLTLMVEGETFAGRVSGWISRLSRMPYAVPVDPTGTYEPPKVK